MKRGMCTTRRRFLAKGLDASTLALAGTAVGRAQPGPASTVAAMAAALRSLSSSVPAARHEALHFPFAGDERFDWSFVPRPRKGVPLGDLDEASREKAHALLRTGLGASGYTKVTSIISLENVLKQLEGGSERRDPRRYYVRAFGEPGAREPWGWSFEGHHVSLNYAVVGDHLASSPAFLGANPAEVRHGEKSLCRHSDTRERLGPVGEPRRTGTSRAPRGRPRSGLALRADRESSSGSRRSRSRLIPSGGGRREDTAAVAPVDLDEGRFVPGGPRPRQRFVRPPVRGATHSC